jgi:hypothetical protein
MGLEGHPYLGVVQALKKTMAVKKMMAAAIRRVM